jgi:ADP-ribosylglycohydrolase
MSFSFSPKELLKREIFLLEQNGIRVPDRLKAGAGKIKDEGGLLFFYGRLRKLPGSGSLYKATPKPRILVTGQGKLPLSGAWIRDRVRGGWFGRVAGCILGKPLECGLTMEELKEHLGGDFPVTHYLRYKAAGRIAMDKKPALHPKVTKPCSREHISYAMIDDDLNYTVLNLLLLEQKGAGFRTSDVGDVWSRYLPPADTWGAETTAFVNYLWGMPVEKVPVTLNPFREEIGAQIRADMFGYVSPGNPGSAADMAFRDASFSHINEGVYGEMFAAGMIASAFTADNINDIVAAGLGQVPRACSLADLVRSTLKWYSESGDWQKVYAKIKEATPEYSDGDTVNNTAYIVNALLASGGDYEKAITTAVMQGHDADCTGATVGSVMGVFLGFKKLPGKWIRPLNDCLHTGLVGHDRVTISGLAERTLRLIARRPLR